MIICNATPLIAFTRIGEVRLLQSVVGQLVIPRAVADEIRRVPESHPGFIDLGQYAWIEVRNVHDQERVRLLRGSLDLGEAEVIALALEHSPRLVLMDDLRGRSIAAELGLPISGTAGLLISAKQQGQIQQVRPFLEAMVAEGIRYSERFLRKLYEELNE